MIIMSVVAAGASACYGEIRGGDVGIKKAEIQDERDQTCETKGSLSNV